MSMGHKRQQEEFPMAKGEITWIKKLSSIALRNYKILQVWAHTDKNKMSE